MLALQNTTSKKQERNGGCKPAPPGPRPPDLEAHQMQGRELGGRGIANWPWLRARDGVAPQGSPTPPHGSDGARLRMPGNVSWTPQKAPRERAPPFVKHHPPEAGPGFPPAAPSQPAEAHSSKTTLPLDGNATFKQYFCSCPGVCGPSCGGGGGRSALRVAALQPVCSGGEDPEPAAAPPPPRMRAAPLSLEVRVRPLTPALDLEPAP